MGEDQHCLSLRHEKITIDQEIVSCFLNHYRKAHPIHSSFVCPIFLFGFPSSMHTQIIRDTQIIRVFYRCYSVVEAHTLYFAHNFQKIPLSLWHQEFNEICPVAKVIGVIWFHFPKIRNLPPIPKIPNLNLQKTSKSANKLYYSLWYLSLFSQFSAVNQYSLLMIRPDHFHFRSALPYYCGGC